MPEAALAEERQSVATKARILVIDDESEIREMLELLLNLEGYSVYLAPNATEGIKKLEAHIYDLVLLDVMMPDRSWWSSAQRRPAPCSACPRTTTVSRSAGVAR